MITNCETCGVEFQNGDFVSGKQYYSCSRCRKYNRKTNGYTPFEFLRSLKAKMRDSKLVNQIWDKIHHKVLDVSGGEVFELSCYREKDFDKMISLQNKNYDYYKAFNSHTEKVEVGGDTYYWTVYYH